MEIYLISQVIKTGQLRHQWNIYQAGKNVQKYVHMGQPGGSVG